ncbi:MAG: DUF2461 domain-containing protein [Flavobacterium sp.]
MLTNSTFEYLDLLKKNNNRDWFTDNKKRFEFENKNAKNFFTEVLADLEKIDSIERMQVFRIYRDVRFSKDKTPYKTHFSVGFTRTKPLLRGGMYLHIEDGGSFVGGGFWEPNNEDLQRIRKELELDASELRAIINDDTFKQFFKNGLEGEELKTAPKGFDKTHPDIDLIRKKQFLIGRNFSNKEVLASNFKDEVVKTFAAMRPFFDYMSDVLTTDLKGESLY